MRDYSPKRRTALVFAGSGTSGAYHAGALRALDESGVKIDVVVGSGIGAVAAAYAAVGGGAKLYGPGGFWADASWSAFFRLRPALRLGLALLGVSFGIVAAPVLVGVAFGLLFPLLLIADRAVPGVASRFLAWLWVAPEALSGPYLAAQAVPVFLLAMLAIAVVGFAWWRHRRRLPEAFEAALDAKPGLERLKHGLGGIVGGAAGGRPDEAELGRRYVALLGENLGEPGFRELVLRTADLERGGPLAFALLREGAIGNSKGPTAALATAVDLRGPGQDRLFFDALATGLLCPLAMPLRRVVFPKGSPHAGETHRLTEASLVGGCGIAEAVAAGAEQVILVAAVPERPAPPARRRGPLARLDAAMRTLEAQAVREADDAQMASRMAATLGHRTPDGRGAWQDPATGRVVAELDLWVIRPEARVLGPLELDGAVEPATEVVQTTEDLMELGFRDAYRLFVEPVVGQSTLPEREEGKYRNTQPVEI